MVLGDEITQFASDGALRMCGDGSYYDVDASTNAGMILPTAIWSGESRYIYH